MIKKQSIFILLLFSTYLLGAQNKFTISGIISDYHSGEKLIFTNIIDTINVTGCASNHAGFYSITLTEGKVVLNYSFVGYKSKNVAFILKNDTLLNVSLNQDNQIEEVIVTGKNQSFISRKDEVIQVPMKTLEKLPVMGGEPDVLKSIQLLPGISPGSEGNTGFSVRGGNIDQNDILFDGVPVYNANHVFGFFSVFNNDIINDIHFYSDYLPPKYGGRLSSVIDIYSKEGNLNEYHGALSIGLLSSKLALEGPIIKNKTSFILSARRSYIDLFAGPIVDNFTDYDDGSYYFYDINAKIRHKFSDRSNLQLSIYHGKDYGESSTQLDYSFYGSGITKNYTTEWGNLLSTLQWQYILSKNLFFNYTLNYSNYNFEQSTSNLQYNDEYQNDYLRKNQSRIKTLTNKLLFNYIPGTKNNIEFGLDVTNYNFIPGVDIHNITNEEQGINIDTTYQITKLKNTEYAFHFTDEITLTDHLKVNAGGRLTYFTSNDQNFLFFDPRISMNYRAGKNFTLRLSYNRTHQFIHLLTTSQISQASDLWLPSSKSLKPQLSNQYSIALEYSPGSNYSFSLSPYYKDMDHLTEYSDGASYLKSFNGWNEITEQGKGMAYGIDFFAEKKTGKTTGWIAYTYSHSERNFEEINNGETFLYKYDRPHVLKIAVNQKLNAKWNIGITWNLMSGSMATIATQKNWDNLVYEKNAYRLPTYHRLDLSINHTKQRKWGTTQLGFGVYNAYNRDNIYNVEMGKVPYASGFMKTGIYYVEEKALFPIIPFINYKIEF
jgi:hypothetical protein